MEPQPIINPSPERNILKPILIGLGIFVFLSSLATAGYLFAQNRDLKQQLIRVPQITPVAVSPSLPPDPTSNWQTYTNTIYGFEFSYPPELTLEQKVEPEKQSSIAVSGNLFSSKQNSKLIIVAGFVWGIDMNATGLDAFKSCTDDYECYQLDHERITQFPRNNLQEISTTISNRTIHGYEFSDGNQRPRTYSLSHRGRYFSITFNFVGYTETEINNAESLIDQILSTFRFSDPSEVTQ